MYSDDLDELIITQEELDELNAMYGFNITYEEYL
jgi:hypothetical protein